MSPFPQPAEPAGDRIDNGRLARLMQAPVQEPAAAVPGLLMTRGGPLEEIVVIEQRSAVGALYLPPMSRYSLVTRLDDAAKVMSWGGCTVEHRDRRHETFIVPPFQSSCFVSRAPAHSIGIALAPGLLARLARDEAGGAPIDPAFFGSYGAADGVLCGLALAAMTQARQRSAHARDVLRCIAEAIGLHLLEQRPAPARPPRGRLSAAQLSRVAEHLHAHFGEALPVSRLADLLGMGTTSSAARSRPRKARRRCSGCSGSGWNVPAR